MLIIIEGTDGSGKETQTNMLYERMKVSNKCRKLSFPNYDSPSSAPVKMYLAGEFGTTPNLINPYAVSSMYAVDRFCSFAKDWAMDYYLNKIIICDRYTTSNMIYQASKFSSDFEKEKFMSWIEDLEYNKMGLPKPDYVIFLDMPIKASMELMDKRHNKITNDKKKDIHEDNFKFMNISYLNSLKVSKICGWNIINCVDRYGVIKSKESIHEEIYARIMCEIKKSEVLVWKI